MVTMNRENGDPNIEICVLIVNGGEAISVGVNVLVRGWEYLLTKSRTPFRRPDR